MSNKYKTTQYVDGLTTASRSILNSQNIDVIEQKIETIADVVAPENVLFGDGTLVNTQATRAEDIVSVEDVRLQGEIDTKVDITTYTTEQAAQDTLIAGNTTAITSNDADIAALDNRVTNNEGDIATINTELAAQTALDAALIAENVIQDNRLDAVENKDAQQDGRLDILEGEIGTVGVVSSVYEDSVLAFNSTAPVAVTPNIITDFSNISIAENNFIDQTPLSVIVKQDSQVRFDFNYTVANATASTPKITVELYNVTKSTLIDKNELTLDFSGSTSVASGNQFNIGEVLAGDEVTVFVYIDAGVIDFTQAKGLMTVTTSGTTTGETIYDYDVISTSSIGGATTLEDINYLNTNKADKTELENKADLTYVDGELNKKVDLLEDNDLRRKRTRFTRIVNSDSSTVIQMTITDLDTATTTGSVSLREDDTGVYLRGTKITTPTQDQDFTPKFYVDTLRDGLHQELMIEIKSLKAEIEELKR